MKYKEAKPVGFLSNFVQCFWQYENAETEVEHIILPDGYFDLIAEFESEALVKVKLTGVWTKPVKVTIPKRTKLFAIRFKLLAAEYLFNHEIKSILDSTRTLSLDFWRIHTFRCEDFEKFVSDISNQTNNSLKHIKEIENRKIKLFDLIYQHKGLTVNELAQNVSWSSRQMNRYFNNQFGFSLKVFLNIVRCNSSYKDIAEGQLFPQKDYFDQAHFIKEVKKHTGVTPKELLKNKNDRFLQLSTNKRK